MSRATFNRVTVSVVERAKKEKLPLEPFTVHDLRRTGSTLLNELGFNRDWIEKCLAHEEGRSSRGVSNNAEYEQQRRHMLQEWADMIDAWAEGRRRTPTLYPPSLELGADIPAQPVQTSLIRLRVRLRRQARKSGRDRACPAQAHVGRRRALEGRGSGHAPTLFDPGFDLGQVPHHAARRQIEPAWKLSALLQFIDRRVCQRHDPAKFRTPDHPPWEL
jgi:hypothetical protein